MVGHHGSVNTLLISGDGQTLISGSDDTTIKFWNIEIGEEIHTLTEHDDSVVNVLAISSDGKRLVSGDSDGNIIIWDINDVNPLKKFDAHSGGVLTLAISPDGYTLASGGGDNLIKIWRVED